MLLFLSSHTCTQTLFILTPSFSSRLSHPTISPPPKTQLRRARWMQQAMLYVSLLFCVCVSAQGWQKNNNNAACPTSFIRLHKLIRLHCSHHLFYWERRSEHSQEMWGFECWSVFVWSRACMFWREGQMECDAVIWVLEVEQKCVSFWSCVGDLTHCMWFVGMCE